MSEQQAAYTYNKDNVFYKIIHGIIKSDRLYEDAYLTIIKDINPVAQMHFLAISKGEYVSQDHFIQSAQDDMILGFFHSISTFTRSLNIQDHCRILTNNGLGQSVRHFHVHIISGDVKDNDFVTRVR